MGNSIDDRNIEEKRLKQARAPLGPHVLAAYLQLSFNAVLLLMVLTLLVKFFLMVRDDVSYKVQEKLAENLRTIENCKKNYEQNDCSPEIRVPALDNICDEWFHCMTRNENGKQTNNIRQSGTLWARTLAEILNSFIEPISLRTTMLILVASCAIVLVTNVAFGSYRVYYYNDGLNFEDKAISRPR